MKISKLNNLNENTQHEITITDCNKRPIFKSNDFYEAALFYLTHQTPYDFNVKPRSELGKFVDCVDSLAEELDCSCNCLVWGIKGENLFIRSDPIDDDLYFSYSKLERLVKPNNIEDYLTSHNTYSFEKGTSVCDKVSRAILNIIKKESKDYNI